MTYLTSKRGTGGEHTPTFRYLMARRGEDKGLCCKGFRYLSTSPTFLAQIHSMGKIAGGGRLPFSILYLSS
jgi:hypothetical protein